MFLTQIILLTLATFLGIILFKDRSAFFDLFIFDDLNILLIGVPAGVIVVLIDILLDESDTPSSYQDDGGINERIFSNLPYPMIFVVALVVAVSEEVLPRSVANTFLGCYLLASFLLSRSLSLPFNGFLFLNVLVLSFLSGFYLK